MLDFNIALATDSYKVTHALQYPRGTTNVYSYMEARARPDGWADEVVFFGLQYMLDRLQGCVVTPVMVEQAAALWGEHFGADHFNAAGWMRIANEHGGHLPVVIRAVPEGTVVPTRNVLMTIENTDRECYWLTNWLETYLVQVWYPCTVATQSREMKRVIADSLSRTGDPSGLPFKLHDFGFRGVSCFEQAAIGGAAHLVNFAGTDTFAGVQLARKYYDAGMPGFSIPATEHSTITSWGKAAEVDAFRNLLETYPTGIVACVSDSYDIVRACREYWGGELRDLVLKREGTLVVRPDSGDPRDSVLMVLRELGRAFGYTRNSHGYMVLPPQVRVIQGDGIDLPMLRSVLRVINEDGWSTDNVAFGSGGGLLQKLDRDTLSFAFKCSHVKGSWFTRDVYKDPTGMPSKASKRGRLKLVRNEGGEYVTTRQDGLEWKDEPDQLVEVFRDGEIKVRHTFDEIRDRAAL